MHISSTKTETNHLLELHLTLGRLILSHYSFFMEDIRMLSVKPG